MSRRSITQPTLKLVQGGPHDVDLHLRDSSTYDDVLKKDPNKLTAREKVILNGSVSLFPLKRLPPPGALVYAKSNGSVYWPAMIGHHTSTGETDERSKYHIIFLEEAFRIDFVVPSKIIPLTQTEDDSVQKQFIEELNGAESKTSPTAKKVAWIKSFQLARDFSTIPLEDRLAEQEVRFLKYKQEKQQTKKPRVPSEKRESQGPSNLQENGKVSTKKPERKSDHYGLRQTILTPKTKDIHEMKVDQTKTDDEIPSKSTGTKPNKSETQPKEGPELEAVVKARFNAMPKSYETLSVAANTSYCSQCSNAIDDTSAVSCHGMPFHGVCVQIEKVPQEGGGVSCVARCKDCTLKRCFVCKSNELEPVKCSKCELYFHRKCLMESWPQAEVQGSDGTIICPIHSCHTCKYDHKINGIPRSYGFSKQFEPLRCVLCLSAYHKNTCVPAGTLTFNEGMICLKHQDFYRPDTNKCRKLGCLTCGKKIKGEDTTVTCSVCPRTWHKECAGIPPDVQLGTDFKCESCVWGSYPLYGDVVWYHQPGSTFWPAIILYQQQSELRSVARMDERTFSIQYCGSKHQFYDSCHFTRSLPLLVGDAELFKQFNLFAKPAAAAAYQEALILTGLSEAFRKRKLPKPKPVYKHIEKNQYKTKVKMQPRNNDQDDRDEKCTCGDNPEASEVCNADSGCFNRSMSMECSDKICSGGDRCVNRFFSKKSQYENALEVFEKNGMGFGLRCKIEIPEGSYIIEYKGEVISLAEKQKRLSMHKETDPLYLLELDQKKNYIDAEFYGNLSRLMNHSCEPNCKSEKYHSASGKPVIGIFAQRNIDPFEEITFNYGDENYVKHCRCGKNKCINKLKETKVLRATGDASKWDNQCSVCNLDGNELLMCEYAGCRKVYHFGCVGLSKMPRGVYHCPCHNENRKSSKPKKSVTKPGTPHVANALITSVNGKSNRKQKNPAGSSLDAPKKRGAVSPDRHRSPLLDSNPMNHTPRFEPTPEEEPNLKVGKSENSMEPDSNSKKSLENSELVGSNPYAKTYDGLIRLTRPWSIFPAEEFPASNGVSAAKKENVNIKKSATSAPEASMEDMPTPVIGDERNVRVKETAKSDTRPFPDTDKEAVVPLSCPTVTCNLIPGPLPRTDTPISPPIISKMPSMPTFMRNFIDKYMINESRSPAGAKRVRISEPDRNGLSPESKIRPPALAASNGYEEKIERYLPDTPLPLLEENQGSPRKTRLRGTENRSAPGPEGFDTSIQLAEGAPMTTPQKMTRVRPKALLTSLPDKMGACSESSTRPQVPTSQERRDQPRLRTSRSRGRLPVEVTNGGTSELASTKQNSVQKGNFDGKQVPSSLETVTRSQNAVSGMRPSKSLSSFDTIGSKAQARFRQPRFSFNVATYKYERTVNGEKEAISGTDTSCSSSPAYLKRMADFKEAGIDRLPKRTRVAKKVQKDGLSELANAISGATSFDHQESVVTKVTNGERESVFPKQPRKNSKKHVSSPPNNLQTSIQSSSGLRSSKSLGPLFVPTEETHKKKSPGRKSISKTPMLPPTETRVTRSKSVNPNVRGFKTSRRN